jgi:hypothetical protein
LALGAGLLVSATADAATPGAVHPAAQCNYAYHTMDVSTSFRFDLSRYPNGGYVKVKYAYDRVNQAGQRIGDWHYLGWLDAGFVRPNVRREYDYINNYSYWTVDDNDLDDRRLPVSWGHWKAYMKVAVWNGSEWEFTPWTEPPGYQEYGRYGGSGTASDCWVSLNI